MKKLITFFSLCVFLSMSLTTYSGTNDDFNSEKMLSDLEKQLKLSREKLEKLKPALDAKSAELKQSMHDSIDKGFVELEQLSEKLDAVSKDAEKKVREVLTSEEMQQLQDYLSKIDKDAINRVKETLIAEFSAILKLSEEQAVKLKPIIEDSFNQLAGIMDRFAREGMKSLEDFKTQYDQLTKELNKKLKDTLDRDQMESLEKHSEELKVKIQDTVFI